VPGLPLLTTTLAVDHYLSSVGGGEVKYISFFNFDVHENNENTNCDIQAWGT
jgi:hypothetical protein